MSESAPSVQDRLKGPAIGLLIVGVLGVLLGLWGILSSLLGIGGNAQMLQEMERNGQQVPEFAKYMLGAGGSVVGVLLNIVGIGCSALVFYGGLQMQKLQAFNLAMAASVVAMIPCLSPCCCIGIPIGIWALIVLNKPDVRAAFS